MSKCISIAQARTKCGSGLRISPAPQHHHPQHYHPFHRPPQHYPQHHHLHLRHRHHHHHYPLHLSHCHPHPHPPQHHHPQPNSSSTSSSCTSSSSTSSPSSLLSSSSSSTTTKLPCIILPLPHTVWGVLPGYFKKKSSCWRASFCRLAPSANPRQGAWRRWQQQHFRVLAAIRLLSRYPERHHPKMPDPAHLHHPFHRLLDGRWHLAWLVRPWWCDRWEVLEGLRGVRIGEYWRQVVFSQNATEMD